MCICVLCGTPLFLASMAGCLQRTIHVTTEPPGAIVWINDVEAGRTPLETDFTFYGKYSVRVHREGYEPLVTTELAKAPLHELPVIDLFAEAIPARFENHVRWHYVLTPVAERTDPDKAEADLLHRARATRAEAAAGN